MSLQVFTPDRLAQVRAVEDVWRMLPQDELETEHVFHAGMYSRTIHLNGDMLMTNVLIKRSTLVIVEGTLMVLEGDGWAQYSGYNVIPAPAGRKQVFATLTRCSMTMIFPTEAKTIAEAEAEFTDEVELLASRRSGNHEIVIMTGD